MLVENRVWAYYGTVSSGEVKLETTALGDNNAGSARHGDYGTGLSVPVATR